MNWSVRRQRSRNSLRDLRKGEFLAHRHHSGVNDETENGAPADVYFGRGQTILLKRERIKRKTIELRSLQHRKAAA